MKTSASFFSGGGLFDIGSITAGYTPIWGIEKDDKIAAVARLNGLPVRTADVLDVDFSTLERPDHFHASPPCPNYSRAKTGAAETDLDIAMAEAVCQFITIFRTDTFTLENVMGYRGGESFRRITEALSNCGYWWDATNQNAADFGVPQTRVRLIVRAVHGRLLHPYSYPDPMKWAGWYQAIEDLIPSLPDSEFAPWQLDLLPDEYKSIMLIGNKYNPKTTRGRGYREADEPAHTVTATNHRQRAFIVPGGNSKSNTFSVRDANEPALTVTASQDRSPAREFILDGQKNEKTRMTIQDEEEPAFTMVASNRNKAIRSFDPRSGRIVKMDIRAFARFQTVPDWYQGLTHRINGNGFPCLFAQRILETLS